MFKELKALLPYMRRYRAQYVAGFIFVVAVDGAQLLLPLFVKRAIDIISGGAVDPLSLAATMAWMVATAAALAAGRFMWRFFIVGSSRRIEVEIRDRLFAKLTALSANFFQRNKTGDLMARAINDLQAVRQATSMGLIAFIDGAFMSLAILAILFSTYPGIAPWAIIPLPIITVLIALSGPLIGRLFKKVQERFSTLSDIAQESVSGVRVVKSFVREGWFSTLFSRANEDYQRANMSLVKLFGFFFPFIGFLSGITTMILLRVGGESVILGAMSAGDLVAVFSYLQMLIWPLMGAGFTVNILQRGSASMGRINEVLREEPDIKSPAAPKAFPREGGLSLRGLSFSYPGAAKPSLEGIDLEIRRGEAFGILGRTGSGKSTLVKALPRLVDTPRGAVFMGDTDVLDLDLAALRRAFPTVPQDSFLFSDTIRANIAFGAPGITEARVEELCRITTIARDLKDFPLGLDTVVGEKGLSLSGGQKQRVAMARALAADGDFLVLDDALSAVDTETEAAILDALLRERAGRTTILISHRVSTLERCDSIAVLDAGRVVQRGTHASLVAEEGLYREIWELQRLEGRA